jgi:hypothetical protein
MISNSVGGGNMTKMIKRPLFTTEFFLWANTGNLLDPESYESSSFMLGLMPFIGLVVVLLYGYCLYVYVKKKNPAYIYSISLILYTIFLYMTVTVGRQGIDNVRWGTASRYSGASFTGILGLCTFFSLLFLTANRSNIRRKVFYALPVIFCCVCYFVADKSQWHLAPYRKEAYGRLAENLKSDTNLVSLENLPDIIEVARKFMLENQLNVFRAGSKLNDYSLKSDLKDVKATGFYDLEKTPNGGFRWTDGNAQIFLPNLYSDKDSIRVRLYYYLPRPDTPMVVLNNNLYPSNYRKFENGCEYAFPLCKQKVVFKASILSKSFVPSVVDKSSGDSRVLGLVFNSLSFHE